ncbi:MAG: hypothetical protein VX899_13100 [Myxococcota bacterium]|nr:hypothetical protein [Myxococcota bacterium]
MLVLFCAITWAITQTQFEDWKLTEAEEWSSASTQSRRGTPGIGIGAGCESGVLNLSLTNVALLMTGQVGYQTHLSYDGGEVWHEVDDMNVGVEHLDRWMDPKTTVVHVRWTIREGTVFEEFSMAGAAEALTPVATRCGVPIPVSKPQPSADGSPWGPL